MIIWGFLGCILVLTYLWQRLWRMLLYNCEEIYLLRTQRAVALGHWTLWPQHLARRQWIIDRVMIPCSFLGGLGFGLGWGLGENLRTLLFLTLSGSSVGLVIAYFVGLYLAHMMETSIQKRQYDGKGQ